MSAKCWWCKSESLERIARGAMAAWHTTCKTQPKAFVVMCGDCVQRLLIPIPERECIGCGEKLTHVDQARVGVTLREE